MKPLLFLDIDGVLNSNRWLDKRPPTPKECPHGQGKRHACPACTGEEMIDPRAVISLNRVFRAVPNLKIVLSSSWRRLYDLAFVTSALRERGYDGPAITSKTPDLSGPSSETPRGPHHRPRRFAYRGREIEAWLRANCAFWRPYAVLDDMPALAMGFRLIPAARFIHVSHQTGLLPRHARRAILLCQDPPP